MVAAEYPYYEQGSFTVGDQPVVVQLKWAAFAALHGNTEAMRQTTNQRKHKKSCIIRKANI